MIYKWGDETMTDIVTNKRNNALYNPELKYRFLSEMIARESISEKTAKSYERVLGITSLSEEVLQKDLHDFSLNEIEKILIGFKSKNKNALESYARIMTSYLNWSVASGLSSDNPLTQLRPSDFFNYLTDEESYISTKGLRKYEDKCANAQDSVIIRLLFEGVGGTQMTEIRNLQRSDVDVVNNRLRLVNTLEFGDNGLPLKFTERYIHVEQRTINFIADALKQKTYVKRNGDMEHYNNIRPYTDLVMNDYVLRTSITRTDNWSYPVDRHVVYRRLKAIADSLGVVLTSKYIQRSGMMFYASKLIDKESEKISINDLKMIGSRFNYKSIHNLKGFITIENIKETYCAEEE